MPLGLVGMLQRYPLLGVAQAVLASAGEPPAQLSRVAEEHYTEAQGVDKWEEPKVIDHPCAEQD